MLAAPPKNPTISETEITWFGIMAGRARRVEWIKFRSASQNDGFDIKKSCVRFQTDSMNVSCTAMVASMADPKRQWFFPECIEESTSAHIHIAA